MPSFDIPDDLAEFLEKKAERLGYKTAQEALVRIVYDEREKFIKAKMVKGIGQNFLPSSKKKF